MLDIQCLQEISDTPTNKLNTTDLPPTAVYSVEPKSTEKSPKAADESPKAPPPLVGFNVDLGTHPKQKTMQCEKCDKVMNVKSMVKHMRDIHYSGTGRNRTWSKTKTGDSSKEETNVNSENDKKRTADGNISPLDKSDSKKGAHGKSPSPNKSE